jgi:hypothetical protein
MNKKKILKKILFISISLFVNIVLIIATNKISISYYKNYGQYYDRDVKSVCKVPDGFISLNNIKHLDRYSDYTDSKLRWVIVDGDIGFRDSDDMALDNSPLNNSDFIVKYKNEYYVDKLQIYDLLDSAAVIEEQRNRPYNLGEIIVLRGHNRIALFPYVVIIDSVETESIGGSVLSTIKFKMDRNTYERNKMKIFDHVETDKGKFINNFTFIDDKTVQVKIPAGEKINMIVLKSPDYASCIRRVLVRE